MDIVKCNERVKYVMDVRKTPWPFKDGSVGEVYSQQFLEHLDGPERMKFMNELYRVMAVGAKAEIICPYWSSVRAIQDPTHKWPPVAEASFAYFNENWRRLNGLTHMPIECNFDFPYGYNLQPEFAARTEELRIFAAQHYVNSVNDVIVILTKAERLPPMPKNNGFKGGHVSI